MLCVEIVYSAKVLNTRCIIGHDVELWKVEIALIYGLVDQAKCLECNLCLVDPIQHMVQITKGLIIVSFILCYKNEVNDRSCIVECSWFFTRQQWCNNKYQLSYNCLLFNICLLLNLTKATKLLETSEGRYTLEALVQLHNPRAFLNSPPLFFPFTNYQQGVANQNLGPRY